MKVIHDLKNPIISIQQTIMDPDVSVNTIVNTCKSDLEDMQEMLENMRAEFKYKQGMSFQEELKEVDILNFTRTYLPTHSQLAENGRNNLIITVLKDCPEKLYIKRTIVKRITNNFISNSLKHTMGGFVKITFAKVSAYSIISSTYDWLHVGTDVKTENMYLSVEVHDNGKGIPIDKQELIFNEKESDQSHTNWDGTGLGLPICAQLSIKLDAFIRYISVEGQYTFFRLYLPITQEIGTIKETETFSNKFNLDDQSKTMKHSCNCVFLAEDNKNIMRN